MSRRNTFRALFVILGVLFALILVEVGIRVSFTFEESEILSMSRTTYPPPLADDCTPEETWATLGHLVRPSEIPALVYELKPNVDTCYYGARVTINSQSVRADKEYQIPKPSNTYRILLLGDSQTFGQGVEFEATFGQVLERELNALSPETKVEVINAGVDGYNTAQEAAALVHRGIQFDPDCILILFIANDLGNPNFVEGLKDHLATDRLYLLARLEGDRAYRLPEFYRRMTGREGYEDALRSIAQTASTLGTPVVNCYDLDSRLDALPEPQAWDEIDELQRELDIQALTFDFPNDPQHWLSESNKHLNAKGHRAIANHILEGLKRLGVGPTLDKKP